MLTAITTAISLIITLLPGLLQSLGVISPAISTLIGQLGSALPGLITDLASGNKPSQDVYDILTAFQTEIKALQAGTTLNANDLAIASTLDSAITAALTEYELASKTEDLTDLTPLPEDVANVTPAATEADPATEAQPVDESVQKAAVDAAASKVV
jgi:hypothetical protein